MGAWQEPGAGALLCAMKVGIAVPKAPLQSQAWGVWVTTLGPVQGHPSCPQTLLLWPALLWATPATLSPLRLRSAQMAHALVWEPGLLIYLELALHSLTQGRGAGSTLIPRVPNVFRTLPDLTLLRASALVFLPVLDVMAHVVGATQARIDIFREIFLRRSPQLAVL